MKTLDGKVVVITGAGSGIGRALAIRAADQGALLALSDWDEVGLVETAQAVQTRTHREVRTDKLDVRDRQAMHDVRRVRAPGPRPGQRDRQQRRRGPAR